VPILRRAARSRGPHLPPGQRVPPLTGPPAGLPDEGELLNLLALGELEVRGRITTASNATLYAVLSLDGACQPCVYKPVAGERPLWDFSAGTLARREVAAYAVSAATGWRLVPPTVLRDGPFGPGSVQWWVGDPVGTDDDDDGPGDHAGAAGGGPDEAADGGPDLPDLVQVLPPDAVPPGWLKVLDAEGPDGRPVVLAHADHPDLRRMALLDVITNNTDRKGGHLLRHRSGAVLGIDHGLTFHVEDKLRTVLWGWAGDRLAAPDAEVVTQLATDLGEGGRLHQTLRELLSPEEVGRTAQRCARLAAQRRYPRPRTGWPPLPWPPI
jgi:uncharacterized repeat protein (TIGR03843 family)